jgi:hypothetical protein
MTTLEALRLAFFDDLPAPKEEEGPKLEDKPKLVTATGDTWHRDEEEEAEDEGDEAEE